MKDTKVTMNMTGVRALILLAAHLAALLAVSCGGRGARWPVPLEPAVQDVGGYEAGDGCQVFAGKDFSVSVCPVDWIEAEERYSGGGLANPFGDDPEVMARLVFFTVKLENRAGDRLHFNPVWASLFAGAAVPRSPLDVSDIYRLNRETDDADDTDAADARAKAFRETVFDGTLSLAAGEQAERYLVFTPPNESFEEMTLVLHDLYHGGRDYDPAFVFVPAVDGPR